MRLLRVLLFAISVLLVLSGSLAAQTESATVSGFVSDSTGAALVGAQVQLTEVQTNIVRTTRTNSAGLYLFPSVKPGEYRLSVANAGFKEAVRQGLVLHVQDIVSQNFKLEVGARSETISVVAEGTNVNTTTASVSTVVDRNLVENLPLNGRTFNTLIQLTPGAVIAPSNTAEPGQFSISGQRTDSNYVTVDGVSANFGVNTAVNLSQAGTGGSPAFSAFGSTSSLVSVDAVQEFRVQTSSFAPEYGRMPGGQISIDTRSGTNSFHGGLFDYFRNDDLDANNWFAKKAGLPRAPERQNDFGGFLGGPFVKDRTFFFVSYEALRLRQPHTETIVVPSSFARSSAIAAAAPYLNAFPIPNGPVDPLNPYVAQSTGSFSNPATLDAVSLRIDQVLNQNFTLFGRYNWAPSNTITRPNSPNELFKQTVNTQTATFGTNWLAKPNIANIFRFNYSVQTAQGSFALDDFGGAVPPATALLIPSPASAANSSAAFALPETALLDIGNVSANRETQINVLDSLTWSAGSHQLKFGFDFRQLRLHQQGLGLDPIYLPNSTQDFANTANALIVVLSNKPAQAAFRAYSLYAQDSWRVSPRFTLTYGLRWEINPPPSPEEGTQFASWENVGNPATLQLAPTGTPVWSTRYTNFSPRVGGAYRITEKGDLVLRAGWGIFYDLGTGTSAGLLSLFPNRAEQFFFQSLPVANAASITPTFSTTPPFTDLINGFDPNLELPPSQQWNVALEKSFGSANSLSLTYVGQSGDRLLRDQLFIGPNANILGLFVLTGNGDTSSYEALQTQFRRVMSHGLQILANYTWSHSIDTASSDSVLVNTDTVIPANTDRGSSSFDVRHNLSIAVAYDIPKVRTERVLSAIINDWSIYSVLHVRSGFPIDIRIIGVPIPGLTTSSRPDAVPGEPSWMSDPSAPGGRELNIAAFAAPPTPRQGDLPRNAVPGFGASQLDFSLAKKFSITRALKLQFRADIFNLFNHPNFANPKGLIFGGSFFPSAASTQMLNDGLAQGTSGLNPLYQMGGPRSLQISLKLTF